MHFKAKIISFCVQLSQIDSVWFFKELMAINWEHWQFFTILNSKWRSPIGEQMMDANEVIVNFMKFIVYLALGKKFLNAEFFMVHIFMYSDWTLENTDQKHLRIWTLFT